MHHAAIHGAHHRGQVALLLRILGYTPGNFDILFYYGETSEIQQSSKRGIMSTNTIRLHRVLRTTPERIYRAFLDADAKAKWLPPNGFTGRVHLMDAKVGGRFKMSFTNFTTGKSHSFGGEYLELVPHERLRYTDVFDDPNLPGEVKKAWNGRSTRSGPVRQDRLNLH